MTPEASNRPEAASGLVARLLEAFQARYGDAAGVRVARAPGRVNLIGDHTDYNDGFVLPMTIGQAVYLALRRRADDQVHLYSINFDEAAAFSLSALPGRGAGWQHYVGGVVAALRQRGLLPAGFEAVLYGDVPPAAGLSSSAALEVATLVALQDLFAFPMDGVAAAQLCQQVEQQYVGVQCGIMDQFAARLGRAGHALFLDCRTLAYREVPLALGSMAVVLVDSKAPRALAGSAYNERRLECEAGVAIFRQLDDGIRALRDVTPEMLDAHRDRLSEHVAMRCRHVVLENERVVAAAAALEAGNLARFGMLMNASHASLRDLYEVSAPALDLLVEAAQAAEGVLGARMTGAGFGGCTVNLVEREAIPALKDRLCAAYRRAFALEPAVYVVEENLEAGPINPFDQPS